MNILVTYATTTGNTERVAERLHKHLESSFGSHTARLIDMMDIEPENLLEYGLVILGSSTWGEGELNDTAEDFFDKLRQSDIQLSNVSFAVFGLGDTVYDTFCNVVEIMANEIKSKGGKILSNALKIDKFPDETKLLNAIEWLNAVLKNYV